VCVKEINILLSEVKPQFHGRQICRIAVIVCLFVLPRLLQGVRCFCLDRSKRLLATGSNDCVVRLWNPVVTKQPQVSLFGHKAAVVDVLIMHHLGAVFSCSQDGVSVSELENVKLYSVLSP
jgi:WD40 repeat protein